MADTWGRLRSRAMNTQLAIILAVLVGLVLAVVIGFVFGPLVGAVTAGCVTWLGVRRWQRASA